MESAIGLGERLRFRLRVLPLTLLPSRKPIPDSDVLCLWVLSAVLVRTAVGVNALLAALLVVFVELPASERRPVTDGVLLFVDSTEGLASPRLIRGSEIASAVFNVVTAV